MVVSDGSGKQEHAAAEPRRHGFNKARLPIPEHSPPSGRISIAAYDPRWPELFEREAEKIRTALGSRALRVEHTGSTSVPELPAKPILDILLVVLDSANEDAYLPALELAGYVLCIREIHWHQHRMFKGTGPQVNLHVFSINCPEIDRILRFRDWLRNNSADRDVYAQTKRALAEKAWNSVQDYAGAKTAVVEEILQRASRPFAGSDSG